MHSSGPPTRDPPVLTPTLNVSAENLRYLYDCELYNERDHLHLQRKLFHDRIVSKNCNDLISLAHYNELILLLGYEELKHATKLIPKFNLEHFLDINLEKIYMYCR